WTSYELEEQRVAPLPGAEEEARTLTALAGPAARLLTGDQASESAIKAIGLEHFSLLHFATHALLSPLSPARSALLMAGDEQEDGFFQAREIAQFRFNADLVVLSACQTAGAEDAPRVEPPGLADSFFYAGATAVVASLWPVGDRPANRFMDRFYHHLAGGESKASALRHAKLEILADHPEPSQWAPFVLTGVGELPLAPGTLQGKSTIEGRLLATIPAWLALVALVATGLVSLLRRRPDAP
ncbi:MAG: CHAT domain-containing protein, partial [Thermoanaerobaculia bacterium]|nr:CHAT domain-containing protein [Thermoanaerobaculia bacterium]